MMGLLLDVSPYLHPSVHSYSEFGTCSSLFGKTIEANDPHRTHTNSHYVRKHTWKVELSKLGTGRFERGYDVCCPSPYMLYILI